MLHSQLLGDTSNNENKINKYTNVDFSDMQHSNLPCSHWQLHLSYYLEHVK